MNALTSTLALAATMAAPAHAFWRMECPDRTGVGRIDPIVNYGEVSDHAHTIHGASNVDFTSDYDSIRASECTSCRVKEDMSLYWVPTLNLVMPNGTSVIVPQTGGMLAYYLLNGDNIKAFKQGFQMLAGDRNLRNFSLPTPDPPTSAWGPEDKTQVALGQKALGFNCLNYGRTPEPTAMRHELPDKGFIDANCANGIRAEIYFPSCSNGELDSDNHRDHMAYPDLVSGGTCPDSHPIRTVTLLYEVIWDTYNFDGVEGDYVFSHGDPTGCGYHGDFIMGWEEDFLQSAIDQCTNLSGRLEDCPVFSLIPKEEAVQCKFKQPPALKGEDCTKPHDGLPGGVPIQRGPAYAQSHGGDKAPKPPKHEDSPAPQDSPAPPAPAAPEPAPAPVEYKAEPKPIAPEPQPVAQEYGPPAAPPAAPETTPPAVLPAELPEGVKVLTTSTYTSAGAVYEVVMEEVVVTVTEVATQYVKMKRREQQHAHNHAHAHAHRRHI